MQINIAGCDTK